MTKKKLKVDAAVSSRERTVTWADDQKKYMLDWYIDYLKDAYSLNPSNSMKRCRSCSLDLVLMVH
jgi:hypothetical protein